MTPPVHGHAAVPYPAANCAAKIIDQTGQAVYAFRILLQESTNPYCLSIKAFASRVMLLTIMSRVLKELYQLFWVRV